ncbi:uncharacterized protein [Diadema antillarum]|uniref:uncharacterized protein n=1 Tax=Diadema antillarum TaxID=105358 RepID=UPI003A8944C3
MSEQERPRSRSASRSPRQDSWYTLVQEEVLVSSPCPSPRFSGSGSSSRASSKASSVSSTPRRTQHPPTSSTTTAASDGHSSTLQNSTLSQYPLEEESPVLVVSGGTGVSTAGQEHASADAHRDVISPLGGVTRDDGRPADDLSPIPPLNLAAHMDSQEGDMLRPPADDSGGITKEMSPFVEDDEGTMMSSDTDIPIPFSDADENDGSTSEGAGAFGGSMVKDAVQEAIAEVSADLVSGALSMSISHHEVDSATEQEELKDDANVFNLPPKSAVQEIDDTLDSAATTPWQSEGVEQATPSPVEPAQREGNGSTSVENQESLLQGEDRETGLTDAVRTDRDSLRAIVINECVDGRAEVASRESDSEHLALPDYDSGHITSTHFESSAQSAHHEQTEVTPQTQYQRTSVESHSKDSLDAKYLSPTEVDIHQDAQSYIQYPRDLQSSPHHIGLSSDESYAGDGRHDRNLDRHERTTGIHYAKRDQESEGDLLARRVALLLQVNGDFDAEIAKCTATPSRALSGSMSSSVTGSPDSIEEANLPLGILSRDASGSPAAHRRGDGQSLPATSRTDSSGSSTDSLAEHVRRLLQESESLRRLHEAGIDTQQLLNIQAEVGKSSPTISEASTSSSVRDIINRVVRRSRTGSESDDGFQLQEEGHLTPSPRMPVSAGRPVGITGSRSREDSGLSDSSKITFQQTFQSSRAKEGAHSVDSHHSSESTLTRDSLSQRVQELLSVVGEGVSQPSVAPSGSLSKEDLIALMQVAELERKLSEGYVPSQRSFSPRSTQNSRMSSVRDGVSSSVSGKDTSVASADSLALRVQAILGREAPGERVDRIISEALSAAERSQSQSPLGSNYSSPKSHKTPSPRDVQDPSTVPSLGSVADLVERPYGAFDHARDMLTLHLQRLTDRTFDHSVEMGTPFQQDTNGNVMNMKQYSPQTLQSSQQRSHHEFQTPSSHSISKPISSEHVFYGLLPEQIPGNVLMDHDQNLGEFHPLPMEHSPAKQKPWQRDLPQQYHPYQRSPSKGQRPKNESLRRDNSSDLDDSLFIMARSKSSPEIKVDKKLFPGVESFAPSHQRSGSWGRQSQFQQMKQPLPGSKLPVPSRSDAVHGKTYSQEQQYPSRPASQTPQHLPSQQPQSPTAREMYSTNSWPRSLSKSRSSSGITTQGQSPGSPSRQSLTKDPFVTDGFLKAYRPPGSSEVIYTYPVDGQGVRATHGSPTMSSTTMESTHTGSDDAHAPSFPAGTYGSRTSRDPTSPSPHSSKIPRFDHGYSRSPPKSPQDRGRGQLLTADSQLEGRRYRRSLSDSGRQEIQKEKLSRQTSLSPQHRAGRARSVGLKREHSRSPPELPPFSQQPYSFDRQQSGPHQRDVAMTGPLVRDRTMVDRSRQEGYRFQEVPGWEASRVGRSQMPSAAYQPDAQYRQQYSPSSRVATVPTSAAGATSPTKIPRYRQGPDQVPTRYAPAGSERAERRGPGVADYPERHYQQYGTQYGPDVPQLPGTYSRQVLENILQNEADPRYREASAMWDQYQRLQQQKEARREARREARQDVKGDESSVSSLDSRRVDRLAHLVQDPVKHTVDQFVQDEEDGRSNSSSTVTDGSTPRQRRKWDRDQQQFTPREQSPEKMPRNGEFQRRVSPEEIAAIVQTSPTKESRIPRSTSQQNGHKHHERKKRKETDVSAKRSPEQSAEASRSSTLQYDTSQDTLTELAASQDMSLESDRLLQLLGPDGIRKLSSKLVKLQRKIDRQREQHRKRADEKGRDESARRDSSKRRGHREEATPASTPTVDESMLSSAASTLTEDSSDVSNGHHRLGKQASLEPSLSPVQEASFRSTEESVYDTAESSPPEAKAQERQPDKTEKAKESTYLAKRRRDYAHKDDFGVTYNTDSLSDTGSDVSIPCACRPKRSHSIHGITNRAREQATEKMSKQTKMDVERNEVFKKPSKSSSRIPVRDVDVVRENGAAATRAQEKPQKQAKPGTAFVIDVGQENKLASKDNVLTRRQNDDNKEVTGKDDERRRRKMEKREIVGQENEAPSRIPKKIVQPVAWFQPLSKKMPWQQDTPTKARPQPMSFPAKGDEENVKAGDKASLQEAFEKYRSDFISKSRERQRKVKLAAEERHTQAMCELERAQIFHDQRSKKSNPNAHPLSDQHHNPKKRAISKRQMREHTERLYNRLPEVKQKEKEKKRMQDFELNRLRAQIYRKKLSDKVKKKPWSGN